MSEKAAYPPGYYDGMLPPPQTQSLYPTAPGYQPVPPCQPGVYYMPPGPQGQQQQPPHVVVATQPQVVLVANQPFQSFACHIVLSCCVFWCCGALLGLIAFILAMVADSKARYDPGSARQIGKVSIGLSIIGIIIGVILLIVVVVTVVLRVKEVIETVKAECLYVVQGKCFAIREEATGVGSCPDASYTYYANYCYKSNNM